MLMALILERYSNPLKATPKLSTHKAKESEGRASAQIIGDGMMISVNDAAIAAALIPTLSLKVIQVWH